MIITFRSVRYSHNYDPSMKTKDVLIDLQKRFRITNGTNLLFRSDTQECLDPSLSFISQGVYEDSQLYMCIQFQSMLHFDGTITPLFYYEAQSIELILQYSLELLCIRESTSLYELFDSSGQLLQLDTTVSPNGLGSDLYIRRKQIAQVDLNKTLSVRYTYRSTKSIQCRQSTTIAQLKSNILRDVFATKYSTDYDVGFVLVLQSAPSVILEDNQTVKQCRVTENSLLLLEHSGVPIPVTTPLFLPADRLPDVNSRFLVDLDKRRARVSEWKKQGSDANESQKGISSNREARPCQIVAYPSKASSSFFVFLSVNSTMMKLPCSSNSRVGDLLTSGVSFALRHKPTPSDLQKYYISLSDPSVDVPLELPAESIVSKSGITEGCTLMLCMRPTKESLSLLVKCNDNTVPVSCLPSTPLIQVAKMALKQLSFSESLEVTGITSNNGKQMKEAKTVAENGLHSGTIVILQTQSIIRICIHVDDKVLMVVVPRSFTINQVVQKGLSSLWGRPVGLNELEDICVFRESNSLFPLLSPTSTLEENDIKDMEELSITLIP